MERREESVLLSSRFVVEFCKEKGGRDMTEQEYLESLLSANSHGIMRIISPFQTLPLQCKIQQTYLTGYNIVFGKIAENIVKEILISYGASFLTRKRGNKDIDQHFSYRNQEYIIEQKIRDDHDSSKKVGQIQNYNEKKKLCPEAICACWFIDPSFTKNRKYYRQKIGKELYYGNEINNFLIPIFGEQAQNFFATFYTLLQEYKGKNLITFSFSTPIRLSRIKFSNLSQLFQYGEKQEILKCFFAGMNEQEIQEYYQEVEDQDKIKQLLELIK